VNGDLARLNRWQSASNLAFKPTLPDVQLRSDGKLLGTQLDALEQLADIAGVAPLGAFMDQRIPDAGDNMLDFDAFVADWDEWFAPSAAAQNVEAMLSVLRGPSNPISLTEDAIYLPQHLEDLLRCLRLAEAQGSQFRIEVAM
jgi:hypothetical protein